MSADHWTLWALLIILAVTLIFQAWETSDPMYAVGAIGFTLLALFVLNLGRKNLPR